MGPRRWVLARRITTPPRVLPLVPIGLLAIWVAWAVFEAAWPSHPIRRALDR